MSVGEYQLDSMPGCSRICISHGLQIWPQYRGKGYATIAHQNRLKQAIELGYDVILATIVEGNKPQEHLLQKFGWKQITFFDNLKTQHRVYLWEKNLSDPWNDYLGGCR